MLAKPVTTNARVGYSVAEAIERTGNSWVALMPAVYRELRDGGDVRTYEGENA